MIPCKEIFGAAISKVFKVKREYIAKTVKKKKNQKTRKQKTKIPEHVSSIQEDINCNEVHADRLMTEEIFDKNQVERLFGEKNKKTTKPMFVYWLSFGLLKEMQYFTLDMCHAGKREQAQ